MKTMRFAALMAAMMMTMTMSAKKQDWGGRVIDEKGDAFQYYHTIFDTYRTVRFDSYEPVFRLVCDFVEHY